jgi:hypothetical protein
VAIEFKHNGRIWRTDTVEEAVLLRRRLESDDQALLEEGEEPDVIHEDVWNPDTAVELLRTSGHLQKQFLKLLKEKRGFVDSEEIVKFLKIDSGEALAGVLSGLSKGLKKIDRRTSDLYSVAVEWGKDGKVRRFCLEPGFRWAVEKLGWPEKWI